MNKSTELFNYINSGSYRSLCILAMGVVVLVGCGPNEEREREDSEERPVVAGLSLARARVGEVVLEQEMPATVRPADRAVLASKVMGVIHEFPAQMGQAVERGELLVQISAQEIAAKVEQARVADRQAARDLERETELLSRGAATSETVRNLEDRRLLTQSMLMEAETIQGYTRIQAPFAGVVTRTLANAGDLATPGQPLLEIERTGKLRLEADIPETLARGMQLGGDITADVDGNRVQVELVEISSSADPRTRTVPAKFELPEGLDARSGMFARIFVVAATRERIEVPEEAVSSFGQIERVFVVDSGTVRLRIVRTGVVREGWVEIQSGLNGTETVILNPPANLVSGQRVATGTGAL